MVRRSRETNPPATALFGRNISTKLPEKPSKVNMEEIDKKINEADSTAKAKQNPTPIVAD